MEKRRRARINNCLNELKILILDATKKDPSRHSKLEKADILEKTVKHLQELQRQQTIMQQASDPKVINKFKAGFTECANEVSRFPGLEPTVKRRLLQHLSGCINSVKSDIHQHQRQMAQQLHAQLLPSPPSSPEQDQHHLQQQQQHAIAAAAAAAAAAAVSVSVSAVNNNNTNTNTITHNNNNNNSPYTILSSAAANSQLQHTVNGYFLPNGQQVIPTKLSNGNIALVLPPSMAMPTRTASTSSASSNSSSIYERTLACSPICSMNTYAPPSPANSYEAMDCKPASVIQHASILQQPLSLVVKKNIKEEEEQPWRPW